MAECISDRLVVAISSRALFDLDDSHQVYEQEGIDSYLKYQISHENEVLAPGVAFGLTQKLLNLKHPETNQPLVEIILLSRNSADTGLRIFNSIEHHNLNITRAAFTNGKSPYNYVSAFCSHLFLSTNANDVAQALQAGVAAATLVPPKHKTSRTANNGQQLRLAFDGDAVIFSDESEKIYKTHGLEAFKENEDKSRKIPLEGGPFKGFLHALHRIQTLFPTDDCPLRTALVTARDAPSHERVIHTLREWDIRIDEALFLGGLDKAVFLKAFEADIFFDDQQGHCHSAKDHVATGHVPHGVSNA